MGFWKSITKPFRAVAKVVGDVFEGARDVVRGTVGALLSPIAVVSKAIGIEPVMYNALFSNSAKSGQRAREVTEGQRTETLLGSENYAQSREPDQYSVRGPQGMRKERGQYSPGQEPNRVMLGSGSQEEEMLGVMEERRRRGTLLGE